MTYRKEEYDVCGHEVTIQQVRGPDSSMGASEPSAWIDGHAAYAKSVIENDVMDTNDSKPLFDQIKTVVSFMVDNDVYFCTDCNTFYDYQNVSTTGFAGHKCGTCANVDATCTDGGSHSDKCLNPNQKHNARVPTKYRCQKCGRIRKTTPTG